MLCINWGCNQGPSQINLKIDDLALDQAKSEQAYLPLVKVKFMLPGAPIISMERIPALISRQIFR